MNATSTNLIEAAALPPSLIDLDAGSDAALLARLRAGDDAAFEQLVHDNGGRMLASARRLVRTEEDSRDVVQEAFLLAFRSLSTFEGRARLSTWLHRIVVNVSLMRLRRAKRRPERMIEDVLPGFHDDGRRVHDEREDANPTPLDCLERERLRVAVRACIERLPDTYRVVLVLRDLEDLSTEEAAEALGIRPGAVKVRLHRARQALKSLLQSELAGPLG